MSGTEKAKPRLPWGWQRVHGGKRSGWLFCQFLKSGDSGEINTLNALGIEILQSRHGSQFLFQMNENEVDASRLCHEACLQLATKRIKEGDVDVAVLDEVIDAVGLGLLESEQLVELIKSRPPHVELVLTGHRADAVIPLLADYHTDFSCISHPYHQGVLARAGIEY